MNNDVILVIARALWASYETMLPDTPARVAKVVIASLEQNGYSVGLVAETK